MKAFITLICFLFIIELFSQNYIEDNFPTENGKIKYTEVVKVDTILNAESLYLNAKKWFIHAFISSKSVIQTDDKEAKLIIVKGFIEKGHNTEIINPKNWFTLKLEFKDGRYKYTIYDIIYEFDVRVMDYETHVNKPLEEWGKPSNRKMSDKRKQKLDKEINEYFKSLDSEFRNLIQSLKYGMQKQLDDDW